MDSAWDYGYGIAGCIRPSGRMRIETTTDWTQRGRLTKLHSAFWPDEAGSLCGSPALPTPFLVDVLTRVSLAADTNLSAILAPSETIAHRRGSSSNSLGCRVLRETPGYAVFPIRNIFVEQTGHTP